MLQTINHLLKTGIYDIGTSIGFIDQTLHPTRNVLEVVEKFSFISSKQHEVSRNEEFDQNFMDNSTHLALTEESNALVLWKENSNDTAITTARKFQRTQNYSACIFPLPLLPGDKTSFSEWISCIAFIIPSRQSFKMSNNSLNVSLKNQNHIESCERKITNVINGPDLYKLEGFDMEWDNYDLIEDSWDVATKKPQVIEQSTQTENLGKNSTKIRSAISTVRPENGMV